MHKLPNDFVDCPDIADGVEFHTTLLRKVQYFLF